MLPGPQTGGSSLPGHGQSLTERSGTLILFILGVFRCGLALQFINKPFVGWRWGVGVVEARALCGGKLDTRLELFMMCWLPVRYRMGV